MIISHSKRFVMLAPWKSASQTCHATLEGVNESSYERSFHYNTRLGKVVHQHIVLSDFMALPEASLGYLLASFVRNPYDRAFSGFLQLQRDLEHQPRQQFHPDWVNTLVREQISQNMSRLIAAGFDFDEWIALLPEAEIFSAGRNTNMPLHPANYWTHLGDEQIVDFIGTVENFENDFASFCRTIGLEFQGIKSKNVSPDKAVDGIRYSKYVSKMSRRTLDRINDLFDRDFELFGYDKL